MIARLRRQLLGDPCPVCSVPVPGSLLGDHLAWHHSEALASWRAAGAELSGLPRPTRPRPWKDTP